MADLKYKTRANADPHGKPRVYFCCHPDDFDKYSERVFDEILHCQDCAIWYRDNCDEDVDEGHLESLLLMQLFVIPVTTAFLTKPSVALDVEFKFAKERNIPILPIMKESGLEELFNRVCGEIQFLYNNKKDNTGISYEEKLKGFLSAVLVGDEVAGKVRDAFDAYVFLSYRKKDRKHAEELMRLIHKNPRFRDVAIWYDEFLTPGENFNDCIRSALVGCDLFALAVTPNLVNEPNYVANVEYPLAKDVNKPILPAELVPTDKKLLDKSFSSLPLPVDAHDADQLSHRLDEALKRLAIECRDEPQHVFFIGLAYLYGIDVEVDLERGISLIEEAANKGLPEGAAKLVDLYKDGIGVKRDYRKAILWQEKYIELLYSLEDEDHLKKIYDAILNCATLYGLICNYQAATEKLDQCEKLIPSLPQSMQSALYCRVYLSLSKFSALDGDCRGRTMYGEKALKAALAHFKTAGKDGVSTLIGAYCRMGEIYFEDGKASRAERYFKKALGLCAEQPGTDRIKESLNISLCRKSLGRVYAEENDIGRGEPLLTQAADGLEKTVNETQDMTVAEDLLQCYYHLVTLYKNNGNVHKKQFFYARANMVAEALFARTATFHANLIYDDNLLKQAAFEIEDGDLSYAEKNIEQCEKFLAYLSESLQTPRVSALYGQLYHTRGNLLAKRKDLDSALSLFIKADGILSEISEKDSRIEEKCTYIKNLLRMGDMRKATLSYEKGVETYLKAVDILEEIIGKTDNVSLKLLLLKAYDRIGETYLFLWQLDNCKPYFDKMQALCERLFASKRSFAVTTALSEVLSRIGMFYRRSKNFPLAREYFEKAIDVLLPHLKNANNLDLRHRLKSNYKLLSYVCEEMNDSESAARANALSEENLRLEEAIEANTFDIQLMYAIAHGADIESGSPLSEANYSEALNIAKRLKDLNVLPSKDFILKTAEKQRAAKKALSEYLKNDRNKKVYKDMLENAIEKLWKSSQDGKYTVYAHRLIDLAKNNLKINDGKQEKIDLAKAYAKLCTTVYIPLGQLDDAKRALEKQGRLYSSIARKDPTLENLNELSAFYYRYARSLMEDLDDPSGALRIANKRLGILKSILKDPVNADRYGGNLSSTYELLSEIYTKMNDSENALKYRSLFENS